MSDKSAQAQSQIAVASPKLVERFAERYGVDANKLLTTLKATSFRQKEDAPEVTNEQMMALMVVADQYKLNPFTREIFAFPDKANGIVPVVSVDGWTRIINEHPQLDSIEFRYSEGMISPDDKILDGLRHRAHEWIECIIIRKDRGKPMVIREFLAETYRPPFKGTGSKGAYEKAGPWQSHTNRFLRHKALIQCARVAMGFAGIYDEDEAKRIVEAEFTETRQLAHGDQVRGSAGLKATVAGAAAKPAATEKSDAIDAEFIERKEPERKEEKTTEPEPVREPATEAAPAPAAASNHPPVDAAPEEWIKQLDAQGEGQPRLDFIKQAKDIGVPPATLKALNDRLDALVYGG